MSNIVELDRFDPDEVGRVHGEESPAAVSPRLARPASEEPPGVDSSGPHFTAERGLYVCEWGDPVFVRIEFERFDSGSRGELTAEIRVVTTAPGLERQLHHSRLNLMSPRTRADVVRACERQARGERRAWDELLEEAVELTVQAYRRGEPAVLMRDIEPPATAGVLLPHVLDGPGVATIHFGMGGVGKSLEALATAAAIHPGSDNILGMNATARRRVGWLNFEGDGWEPRERLEQLLGVRGPELPDIVHVGCVGAIWDQLDRLTRIVREERIEFGVIDSVGLACGGLPPETSEAALRFTTAFRELRVPGLLIAHQTRSGEKTDDYPFGSVFWHNSARATWLVKREGMPGSSSFTLALINKKSNRTGIAAPIAFDVSFADGRIRFCRRDAGEVEAVAGQMPLLYRLHQALRHGPRTVADVADEVDAKVDTVSKTFRRYAEGRGKLFVRVVGPDGVTRWANLAREVGS